MPAEGPGNGRTFTLDCRGRSLSLEAGKPLVMGVLNVTPDSFYAHSRVPVPEAAVERGKALVAAGAALLDVGGESTRPGAAPVPAAMERERVVPVIRRLAAETEAFLSIDTYKAPVAAAALEAGAHLVNDIGTFRLDPDLPAVVAESGAVAVCSHLRGEPRTMQAAPVYHDPVAEVRAELEAALARAEAAGLDRHRVILDPGIGFGKRLSDNLRLLQALPELARLGRPLLVGVSRKSFIGALLGSAERPLPAEDRLEGSLAAGLWAVQAGAHVLRVHDVAATVRALRVWEAVAAGREGERR